MDAHRIATCLRMCLAVLVCGHASPAGAWPDIDDFPFDTIVYADTLPDVDMLVERYDLELSYSQYALLSCPNFQTFDFHGDFFYYTFVDSPTTGGMYPPVSAADGAEFLAVGYGCCRSYDTTCTATVTLAHEERVYLIPHGLDTLYMSVMAIDFDTAASRATAFTLRFDTTNAASGVITAARPRSVSWGRATTPERVDFSGRRTPPKLGPMAPGGIVERLPDGQTTKQLRLRVR